MCSGLPLEVKCYRLRSSEVCGTTNCSNVGIVSLPHAHRKRCVDLVITAVCPTLPSSCAPIKAIGAQCTDSNYTVSNGSLILKCSRFTRPLISHFQGHRCRSRILLSSSTVASASSELLSKFTLTMRPSRCQATFNLKEVLTSLMAFVISRSLNTTILFKVFSIFLWHRGGLPPLPQLT